jgi:hypothetical protein
MWLVVVLVPGYRHPHCCVGQSVQAMWRGQETGVWSISLSRATTTLRPRNTHELSKMVILFCDVGVLSSYAAYLECQDMWRESNSEVWGAELAIP